MQEVLRYEKKYAIPQYEVALLESLLRNVLSVDVHAREDTGYCVRSLYFDTPENKDFYEKIDGMEQRCKVRLRVYDPKDQVAKLELKEKVGDLQRKRSLEVTKEQAIELSQGNYTCLQQMESSFAQFMYAYMTEQMYIPKCIIEYKRLAFCVETNDVRLTLDRELTATEANFNLFDTQLALSPVGQFMSTVLEVKYNHFLLSYIKDLLGLHNRMQVSESKYCNSRMLLLSD